MLESKRSESIHEESFSFKRYTTKGAHGGHGEQARSSMQKAARAQRSRILGLK